MPRAIKTKTTNSEIKVRIPQMSVTLLLRTAVSSLLQRLVTSLAARILPKQKSLEPRRTPSWSVQMSGQAHRTGAAPCYRNFANTTSFGTYHSRDSLESITDSETRSAPRHIVPTRRALWHFVRPFKPPEVRFMQDPASGLRRTPPGRSS